VFKALVRIDQHTDVEDTMRRLTKLVANGGLAPDELDMVLEQSRTVIENFSKRGKTLAKLGSQMSVSQTIDGPRYSVKIHARFGTKESMWQRIIGVLSRQHRV